MRSSAILTVPMAAVAFAQSSSIDTSYVSRFFVRLRLSASTLYYHVFPPAKYDCLFVVETWLTWVVV